MLSLLLYVSFAVSIAGALPTTVVNHNLVRLPVVRHHNLTGTTVAASDRARAQHFKNKHANSKTGVVQSRGPFGIDVTNSLVSYVAEVQVGSPPQTFDLIVDTGSSNTWVGAMTEYKPTPSSKDTGDSMFVEYGSGLAFGEEYLDTVTIGGMAIPEQSIGVAYLAFGFSGVDGILGLGPVDLTDGTTSSDGTIPTVMDNAFSYNLVGSKVLGVSFEPPTAVNVQNGELTFGGTDSSKITSDINYVPITSTSPASEYVGIDQTITYGGKQLLKSSGITDTGTTLIMIATDAFTEYIDATGASLDQTTGLYTVTAQQYDNLESIFFTIGSVTYEFTKNAQIWPRALNSQIGGTDGQIYLIVTDLGSSSGEGLDFINGMTFLERFYSVFDSATSQFGIATTAFTGATSN